MGECLITRRGGEVKKVPILHSSYPEDVTVSVVDSSAKTVYFTVEISEPGNPHIYTYQWYVAGLAVEGATEATFVLDVSGSKGVYSVWCEVTNKAGTVRTREATLTVKKVPTLNASYPETASVTVTEVATLKAVIAEDGYPANYTYQWYQDGTVINGATGSEYRFDTSYHGWETHSFYCVVSNDAGSVQSRTADVWAGPYYLFNNGAFAPGLWVSGAISHANSYISLADNVIRVHAQGRGHTVAQLTERVDFTGKNTLVFNVTWIYHDYSTDGTTSAWYFGPADTIRTDVIDTSLITYRSIQLSEKTDSRDRIWVGVDISGINGYHYVKWFAERNAYMWDCCDINEIYLY